MSDAPLAPVIVWFRQDLRLADHPALAAAVESGAPLLPVFIWSPEEEAPWAPGAASQWWLHESLQAHRVALQARGSDLVFRLGPASVALQQLAKESGATRVLWSRRWEPAAQQQEEKVRTALTQAGIETQDFPGATLFEPSAIRGKTGTPFQVYTPFSKACLEAPAPGLPIPVPETLRGMVQWPASLTLAELNLLPQIDWAAGLRACWQPGESGAQRALDSFLRDSIAAYDRDRDRPDVAGTSRLSPHLHFGEVSPRQVWHAIQDAPGAEAYRRQILWREFAYHLLLHFPNTPQAPLRAEFRGFPWLSHPETLEIRLEAWTRGRTGYPLVDAGMRELWHSGWMHNRVRMVVASFLVKHLLISWQEGAAWFWDTLVDADLANNTLGWQWAAGCGADAAPYFRVFNPTLQGSKFDPQGLYVRRWVPELSGLPDKWIHQPWAAPAQARDAAGVELGVTYPSPIVDHAQARRAALQAFDAMRGK